MHSGITLGPVVGSLVAGGIATGTLKLAFAYSGLAAPLVEPLKALWLREFDGF